MSAEVRRLHRRMLRPTTERSANVPKQVRTVRDVMREHLREAGMTVEHDLSRAWNMKPHSAHRVMYDKRRSLTPEYIHAFSALLKLDEFDVNEINLLGATEYGWRINPKLGRI